MLQQVGSGSTSDRDNLSYLEDGDVFYNTETGQLQVRKNDGWTSLTKTITDTNAFKITSGTSLPSETTTTTESTTIVDFNTDLSFSVVDGITYSGVLVYDGEQHPSETNSESEPQSPVISSYDLTTFVTNSDSLIGSDVYVYLRYEPGNGNEGDVQISQIKVNDVTYGIDDFNDAAGDFYYTKWQTTYRTKNYNYEHGDDNEIGYSAGTKEWLNVAAVNHKPGAWSRDYSNKTSSGNTGVDIGHSIYYEHSNGGQANQGVMSVFLRTPKITLTTSNTIEIGSYAFGGDIGKLYFGVYLEKKVSQTTSTSTTASPTNNIFYNTSTGKLQIRKESSWEITSNRSITDRDYFKTLQGSTVPPSNTLKFLFYNTNLRKLYYLKNNVWRTVAQIEANETFNVGVDSYKFSLNNAVQPELNLYRGNEYMFNQSSADNIGQRLFVSNDLSGRRISISDTIIYEIPSILTTTNKFTGSNFVLLGSDVTFDWSKDWEIKTSFTINQYDSNEYPRIFSFVSDRDHGSSGSHSEFEILFNQNGKRIGLIIRDPQPFSSSSTGVWISGQNNGTLVDEDLLLNTRYNVLVKYVYSTGVITAGYQKHSNFTSWDDVIIQGTKFVDSSQEGNGGYGDTVTFTESITYQSGVGNNSYIGDRSTKDRGFNGTIHSLTMTNITQTLNLAENTASVTSTGTLGTDLVTTWKIPTDASYTMYYASDGSANAGGKINIFNTTNSSTTPTIVCLNTRSAVNVISSGGDKYRFNGDTTYVANKYYGLVNGTFTFTGVSSDHPIAILNAGKTSLISYTGLAANKSIKTVSGTNSDGDYDFYHGDVTVTVSGDFGSVSVYCFVHGYMGGENLLRYSSSCVIPTPPTGGTVTHYGAYTIHTFTGSATFEVPNNIVVTYLIIGGGGGGSDGDDKHGGGPGGGAGGFVELTNISITPGSYSVIVGAGGSGSIFDVETTGQAGTASSFNGQSALGGGGYGGNGGSGAGEYRNEGAGSGEGSQGNDGGSGGSGPDGGGGGGGGGGGAGAVGGNAASGGYKLGGDGGVGKESSITGTATYYAGGGGGGAQNTPGGSNNGRSNGGLGGGGQGGGDSVNDGDYTLDTGLSGTDGLGGGGGGSSAGSFHNHLGAGDGGDGVVIIRYLL